MAVRQHNFPICLLSKWNAPGFSTLFDVWGPPQVVADASKRMAMDTNTQCSCQSMQPIAWEPGPVPSNLFAEYNDESDYLDIRWQGHSHALQRYITITVMSTSLWISYRPVHRHPQQWQALKATSRNQTTNMTLFVLSELVHISYPAFQVTQGRSLASHSSQLWSLYLHVESLPMWCSNTSSHCSTPGSIHTQPQSVKKLLKILTNSPSCIYRWVLTRRGSHVPNVCHSVVSTLKIHTQWHCIPRDKSACHVTSCVTTFD